MRGGMEVDEGVDISVGGELLPPQVGARSGGLWRSPCAQARANSEVGEGKWRGSQRPAQAAPSGRAGERAPSLTSAQHRPQHSGRAGGPPASARASSARAQHPAACARRAHAQRHCARARRACARGRAPNSSPGLICGDQQQF